MNKLLQLSLSCILFLSMLSLASATLSSNITSDLTEITVTNPLNGSFTGTIEFNQVSWQSCGASFYIVEFSDTRNFSNLLLNEQTITTSINTSLDLDPDQYYLRVYGLDSDVICVSQLIEYEVISPPNFSIAYNDDSYDTTNILSFAMEGPIDATVQLNISGINGFFLPVSFDNLSNPSFSTVLPPDAYTITANMNYYDVSVGFDDLIILPFSQSSSGSLDDGTSNNNNQDNSNQDDSSSDSSNESFYLYMKTSDVDGSIVKKAKLFLKYDNITDEYEFNNTGELNLSLAEQDYQLRVFKDGYDSQSKNIDLDKNKSIFFILDEETESSSKVSQPTVIDENISINLTKPVDKRKYPDYAIPVEFSLSSANFIERCQILTQKQGIEGYAIKDTILSPSKQVKKTISLPEGSQYLQIRCLSSKDDFFLSDPMLITSVSLKESEEKASLFKENIISSLDKIEGLPEEIKLVSVFNDQKTKLEEAKYFVSSILDTFNNLNASIDINQEKSKLNTKLSGYEDILFADISQVSSETSIPFSESEDISTILSTKSGLSKKELENLQELFVIRLSYTSYDVELFSGEVLSYTIISDVLSPVERVSYKENINEVEVYYLLPTSLDSAIVSDAKKEYIDDSIVIQTDEGNPLLLNRKISSNEFNAIKPIVYSEDINLISENELTGYASLESNSWKVPVFSFIGLILVVGLFFNPFFNVFDNSKRKTKKFVTQVHACMDAVENKEHYFAMELFPKIVKLHDSLPKQTQNEVKDIMIKTKELFYECHFNVLYKRMSHVQSSNHVHHILSEIHTAYAQLAPHQKTKYTVHLKQAAHKVETLLNNSSQQKVFKNGPATNTRGEVFE